MSKDLLTKDYLDAALNGLAKDMIAGHIKPLSEKVERLDGKVTTGFWCLGLGIPASIAICATILGWILTHVTLKP